MKKNNGLRTVATVLSMTLAATLAQTAQAAITEEEAARLGADLTPVGAERAGNADGSIPEWTGGLTQVPDGWQRGEDRPDFFAGEKPTVVITADNMAEHADRLTEGMKAMLKQYPEFRIPVYPTHRTAAWPEYVYENIRQQATQAKFAADGDALENVWGAVPFPIPQNGKEVIRNHQTRFVGTYREVPSAVENTLYNNGQRLEWTFSNQVHFTYYDPNVSAADREQGMMWKYSSTMLSPSRDSGEGILLLEGLNPTVNPRQAWTYDPGERRVRRAPNFAFDTPDRPVNTIDDYDMFNGSLERYDFKLLGKREMYVPYNNNELNKTTHSIEETYQLPVINSDLTRYELHRVWVVEASLKPDARHIYSKRVFYVDEDTWTILATDKYDNNGNLWRVAYHYPVTAPEVPVTAGGIWVHYDLKVGAYYSLMGVQGQKVAQVFDGQPPESSYYSSAAMRRRGR
ncbi:hypothetical protein GCM10011348_13250 [Marinobacterium nitratireducens]|uniref:Outer membrane lipoprotein-sorting protein n=1 Tax=Marinobacterium nitratireducens TaxID=518897 RepID=A0A918DQY2_9GAMM|nr:DUF1329 domain-containing protein [Marinobacterium nitratireducens]GGO79303.1 hypothetical protein GCM10011348_13250 [Marinobacterium nitratireducens]